MKALLVIASQVQKSGKALLPATLQRTQKLRGATDTEIHDRSYRRVFVYTIDMLTGYPR